MMLSQENLDEEHEYPADPGWKPFDNLTWLQVESEKRDKQEYMEKRMELYHKR